tara:strand:+ start:693 stop:1526 length:834 start_codon:yes stop_codon:yes gene_type:complete
MELREEILSEISRLYGPDGYEGPDNWNSVRSPRTWSNVATSKEKKQELYEALQASRGLDLYPEKTFEENINLVKKETERPWEEREQFRIDLLSTGRYSYAIKHDFQDDKACLLDEIETVYELGFRCPRLLKHYEKAGKRAVGFDVVKLNVLIGRHLGYECELHDLSSDEPLFFEENSLIVAYDVFEHLPDPMKAIRKVYDAMEDNSFFHIEVPTERAVNFSLGHFHSFKPGQLKNMIENFGNGIDNFEILASNLYSPISPDVPPELVPQSILCKKSI